MTTNLKVVPTEPTAERRPGYHNGKPMFRNALKLAVDAGMITEHEALLQRQRSGDLTPTQAIYLPGAQPRARKEKPKLPPGIDKMNYAEWMRTMRSWKIAGGSFYTFYDACRNYPGNNDIDSVKARWDSILGGPTPDPTKPFYPDQASVDAAFAPRTSRS